MPVKRSFTYYLCFAFLLILPLTSCTPKRKAAKARKQTEKRLEQRRLEGEKAIKLGKKQHYARQDKETQKRMNRTQRQSQRMKGKGNDPFYKRWYKKVAKR
jgi:ABC-type transport system involved in cytochrome bd biosynthesis fused ATPase/permease subunit